MRALRQLLSASIAIVLLFGGVVGAQQPAPWQSAVVEANKLHADGKIADAIAVLRKARPGLPPIHQLQLVQYLTEQVMESPKMPRAEAQKLLEEARGLTDDLIKRKQEVRMALMAKSLLLKTQADRVEQNAQRKQALIAESDRAYEDSRSVNADGSPVVKTLDDLWNDAQRKAFTTGPDGKDREDVTVYERFLATHRDYVPALLATGRYYQVAGDQISDRSAKAVTTRTRHLETASAHYRRASEVATTDLDAVMAIDGLLGTLDAEHLNRAAEAEPLARAAVKKYPDHPMLVMRLLAVLLPSAHAAASPATLRAALQSVPATAPDQHAAGVYLFDLDHRNRATQSREASRVLLREAAAAMDAALKIKPDYVDALLYKSVVLSAQAQRVEQDPARIKALTAESERLRALATKLMKR